MRNWHGNPWAILLTLSLGFFMTLLDLTIVNIAIPNMIEHLDASLDEVLWVVNIYILVLAVLLITAGRLGDLRGQRNMFIAGVALFTLASLACGISQNPAELIAARAIQGLGAAMLMPQTMALIIGTFPADRRGAALGVWGAVAGVATIAGPTAGGLLVAAFGWRWIFFVNLPIGILVLIMAVTLIPDTRLERRHRLDLGGVLFATAALFCLVFALTEGERFDWNAGILASLGGSVVLLAGFLLHQRSQQDGEPLLPFALFRDRNFSIMNFVGATVSIGMIGIFLPTVIYLQSVLGYSSLKAGLVMSVSSLLSIFLAPVAGPLSDRIGGKYILMTGLILYGAGTAWMVAIAEVGTDWPALVPSLIVAGVGIGCVFAPMATEAMRGVPPPLAGAAAGVNNTIRQVGSVVGSAAVGAVLQHQLADSLRTEAGRRAAELPAAYRGQVVAGFSDAAPGGLEAAGALGGGAQPRPPPGLSQQAAETVQRVTAEIFQHGFVAAMKPAIALPIAAVLVGAVACLAVRGHTRTAGHTAAAGAARRAG
jgi:EmrB/QacA subfamily drug resistance transporter